MLRWFLAKDNDGHRFLVPAKHRKEWEEWLNIPSDDERSWDVSSFAIRVDGANVTFTDPYIDGEPVV